MNRSVGDCVVITSHKRKLHVFGCSHTLSGTLVGPNAYKWSSKNSWGELLAIEYDLKLHHHGIAGASNFEIYKQAIKLINLSRSHKDYLNKDDIVIIQWSYINRGYRSDTSKSIMPWRAVDNPGGVDELYYSHFHDSVQCLANVIGYTHILRSTHNNLYFDFVDGSKDLNKVDPTTWNTVANWSGYTGVFSDHFQFQAGGKGDIGGTNSRHPCNHLNDNGNRSLAALYKNKLDTHLKGL